MSAPSMGSAGFPVGKGGRASEPPTPRLMDAALSPLQACSQRQRCRALLVLRRHLQGPPKNHASSHRAPHAGSVLLARRDTRQWRTKPSALGGRARCRERSEGPLTQEAAAGRARSLAGDTKSSSGASLAAFKSHAEGALRDPGSTGWTPRCGRSLPYQMIQ